MARTAPDGESRRIDPETVRLFVVGDLLAILVFVVIGELTHDVNPVASPAVVVGAAVPFFLGWAVVSPLAGAYGTPAATTLRWALVPTALAWLGADVLAQALRSTATFRGDASLVFFLVAGGIGLALIVVLRTAVLLRR